VRWWLWGGVLGQVRSTVGQTTGARRGVGRRCPFPLSHFPTFPFAVCRLPIPVAVGSVECGSGWVGRWQPGVGRWRAVKRRDRSAIGAGCLPVTMRHDGTGRATCCWLWQAVWNLDTELASGTGLRPLPGGMAMECGLRYGLACHGREKSAGDAQLQHAVAARTLAWEPSSRSCFRSKLSHDRRRYLD